MSATLRRAARPIISPGWDDAPADRPRGRSRDWRRLLAGVAGLTKIQPGTCCGCGASPTICAPCNLPASDLTLSWTTGLFGICTPGSTTLFYTPSFPPNIGTYYLAAIGNDGCCGPGTDRVGVDCAIGHSLRLAWWVGTGTICAFTGPWTTTSCSPLHITGTPPNTLNNTCGGSCGTAGTATFTLTA